MSIKGSSSYRTVLIKQGGVNAVLATTTKSATTTTPNGNNINCQSKNGSAKTQTSLGA